MNTPELIYKIITFFFANIWTYLGLLLIIVTIRGDVTEAIKSVKNFVKNVILRYRERQKYIDGYKTHKEEQIIKNLKNKVG